VTHASAKFDVEVKPFWWPGASPEVVGEVVADLIRSLTAVSIWFDPTTLRVSVFYGQALRHRMFGEKEALLFADPSKVAEFLEREVETIVDAVYARHQLHDKKRALCPEETE
jgi:hypothetical protein